MSKKVTSRSYGYSPKFTYFDILEKGFFDCVKNYIILQKEHEEF
jgi:hypothetical protein